MDGNDGVPSMRHIENEVLARSTTFSRSENINKSILHAPYSKQDRGGNFCGTLAEISEKEHGLVIVGDNNGVVHIGLDAIGEE